MFSNVLNICSTSINQKAACVACVGKQCNELLRRIEYKNVEVHYLGKLKDAYQLN